MKTEDIPPAYKKIIDDAAGVEHSAGGNVMRALAGILTMHEQTMADTPSFTLRATDPAAPAALLTYAAMARIEGATPEYVAACQGLASEFYKWQETHGTVALGERDGQPNS